MKPPRVTLHPITSALSIVALILAVSAGGFLLTAPVYSSGQTLVAVNGPWTVVWLIAPAALIGSALLVEVWRPSPWVFGSSAALLGCFVLITGFSVGLYFAPAALIMGTASVMRAAERISS